MPELDEALIAAASAFPVRPGGKEQPIDDWLRISGVAGVYENDVDDQGFGDSVALLQASIDATFAAGWKRTLMPRGKRFKITTTLFLDPPGNLRPTEEDAAWNSGTTYASGDYVAYDGYRWQSQQSSNTNHEPGFANGESWWINNPTNYQWTAKLQGEGMATVTANTSAVLHPTFADRPALYVGPGASSEVDGIGIWGDAERAPFGVGIAIAGGAGGASDTCISNTFVYNMNTGYSVGINADGLGDSNTFIRAHAAECDIGFAINRTQNYIDNFYSCRVSAKIALMSHVGKSINWFGGNPSRPGSARKKLTVTAVSAPTRYSRGYLGTSYFNYKMDFTISSPPVELSNGTLDVFAVELPGWGVIPLLRADHRVVDSAFDEGSSWDADTSTITLAFRPVWLSHNYALQGDLTTLTSIMDEFAEVTELYGADQTFTFVGAGIKATGAHLENPTTSTTLLQAFAAFAGSNISILRDLVFNYEPSISDNYWNATGNDRAIWLCQAVHPFIDLSHGHAALLDSNMTQNNTSNAICIDTMYPFEFVAAGLKNSLAGPNFRFWAPPLEKSQDGARFHPLFGSGNWKDGTPFLASALTANSEDYLWHTGGPGAVEFVGFMPKAGTVLQLTPHQYNKVTMAVLGAANNGSGLIRIQVADTGAFVTGNVVDVFDVAGTTEANGSWTVTVIDGTHIDLQSSTFTNAYTSGGRVLPEFGNYVPIYGKTLYRVDRWDGAGTLPAMLRSNHEFLSYGRDFAADWEHKGASASIYLDTAGLGMMRHGLKFRPKNAGGRTAWYVCNGIYRIPKGDFAGYVTVCRTSEWMTNWFEGDKDTTYTGTVIECERYDFQEMDWA